MKKKTESGESGKEKRTPLQAHKSARVIPSRIWWEGARALWRSLAFRERALILMGILVPALDQISRLASLGITMKAVSRGIRQPLDLESRIWLCLVILGATGISALIALFSSRVKKNLKILVTRLARRIYGRMMAATGQLPLEEREAEIAILIEEERNFMNSATSGALDLIDFVAALSLVVVLLVVLTWFSWIVGAIILVAGLVALLVLKLKIRSSPRKEGDDALEARKRLTRQLESIAGSRKNTESIIDDYADNEFDKLTFAELEAKTSLQKKISSVMGFGSAILMALVFFLVSSEGAFDEHKVVWMVVFIFGLRMVVAHGKSAMVNWGAILGEKKTLMTLAKASLNASSALHDEMEEPRDDDMAEISRLDGGRAGTRIVDFQFSGLNGAEIISREPLVLEVTVESDAEIKGFYWSFSLMPVASSLVLVSKTSEDCGVTWDLPPGRSRFRMVSGPVWLPAGTYSARVGIAKRNRLLDLSDAKGPQATISVLPDEIAKRSIQTRVASDVLLMDVEWELEFRQEKSEAAESPAEAPATI
jgi:ABC-type multidrug transport system fused ATPase/permease subunit